MKICCFFVQVDAIGFQSQPFEFSYDFKDVIRYALSVGASLTSFIDGPESNDTLETGLDLLYENSDNFTALPGFAYLPAIETLVPVVTGGVPGLSFDLTQVFAFIFLNFIDSKRKTTQA